MTAFVPYVTFMKHAKKVARSASNSRPVLKTVIHRKDYAAVTDSQRLYIARNIFSADDERQVDPNTGLDVNHGEYPDVERLLQDGSDASLSQEISVHNAYEAVRAIEIASKVNDDHILVIEISEDAVEFKTVGGDVSVSYSVERTNKGEVINGTTYVDIRYLKEALHVMKDAKVDAFTLEWFGALRPMQLRAGNFMALVVPVRKD